MNNITYKSDDRTTLSSLSTVYRNIFLLFINSDDDFNDKDDVDDAYPERNCIDLTLDLYLKL